MMLTLALKSQIALLKFKLPVKVGMISLPRSTFLIGRVLVNLSTTTNSNGTRDAR